MLGDLEGFRGGLENVRAGQVGQLQEMLYELSATSELGPPRL